MLTPEGDATGGLSDPWSASRGSRRGACDRCRGQKLRCLRDDQGQQAKCVRCFKADATCSFGIPKRAGRPSRSNAPCPQEGRSNGGEKPRQGGMAARASASNYIGLFDSKLSGGKDRHATGKRNRDLLSGETTMGQESEGEPEDTTPVAALSPSSRIDTSNIFAGVNLDFPTLSGSSTATLPWHDETLPPFFNSDVGEASGFEPFGPEYSWVLQHDQAQPMDNQVSPTASQISSSEQSRHTGFNEYGTLAQLRSKHAQMSGMSDKAMELDLPSRESYMAPFNPTEALNVPPGQARTRDGGKPGTPANPGTNKIAKFGIFKDLTEIEAGTKSDDESLSVGQIQHRRMQELSVLAMDLYAQLTANNPETHLPTSGVTATAFQDQLVGRVLKSSNTFLTLLASFPAPVTPSSPFPPPLSNPPSPFSINHNNSICSFSDSDTSPPASFVDYDYPILDESVRYTQRRPITGTSDDSNASPPTDMTTVLQLLTCYIRIIRLHSIMYARILDYMLAFLPHVTQHVGSVPPVFPGMQIGGVSLDKFGTFQVKLLLQISVHVLGEIEMGLGLPEEFCVGTRRGRGRGVLEAIVSGAFMECLISESAWTEERNTVECVREQLKNLKRVLKGMIEF